MQSDKPFNIHNSDVESPLMHNRSKLSIKCTTSFQNNFYRESMCSEANDFRNSGHMTSTTGNNGINSSQLSVKLERVGLKGVKNKIGEYYLSNGFDSRVKKSKQRSLSRAESQKKSKGMKKEMNGVHPEYLIAPPNIPKAKNKKVIEEVKKQQNNENKS